MRGLLGADAASPRTACGRGAHRREIRLSCVQLRKALGLGQEPGLRPPIGVVRTPLVMKRNARTLAMADQYLSEELRDFILERIDSVAQIEALLLIRSDPRSQWSATRLAERLYISKSEAAEALSRLCASELLSCTDEIYRLEGVPDQNRMLIEQLVEVYSHHLIAVTNLVHSKPRGTGSFADAFKFRKGS